MQSIGIRKVKRQKSKGKAGRFLSVFFVILVFIFSQNASAAITPNDPFFDQQWYLQKINAPSAWDTTTGSRDVVVAVLDTGVDIEHPDLVRNMWQNSGEVANDGIDNDRNGFIDDFNGWNFVDGNNNPRPVVGVGYTVTGLTHGTVLAGIIAAQGNNAEGVAGISWRTRIMPVRVLDSEGNGHGSAVANGIEYAVHNGAHIINLSFTTFDPVPEVDVAITHAKDAGVLVVAAAGNDDGLNMDRKAVYPVCSDGPAGENWVVGVSSVDQKDQKSSFSNYGSLCVDLSAPGERIFGTQATVAPGLKTYGGLWSGTSVAAPMVSGVAALVRAVFPKVSRTQLIQILKDTSVPIDGINQNYRGGLGWGRIDASAAVTKAVELSHTTPTQQLVVSADSGSPLVRLFDTSGVQTSSLLAYGATFTGGVRVATGDIDGDGVNEIITGAGPGGGPHVRIFNQNGTVKSQFFAFATSFRGGITMAAGDLDGDRRSEIVVGSGKGASPIVKVFDGTGFLKSQFLAYGSAFMGGIEVATGDIDGDGVNEIITGAGPGGGPHVRIFDYRGNLKGQFFAFDTTYRGGVRLATADTDGDHRAEIVTTRGSTDASEVRIFSSTGTLRNSFVTFADRRTVLAVTASDQDRDGKSEIVVAAGSATGAQVRRFTNLGILLSAFSLSPELKTSLRIASL